MYWLGLNSLSDSAQGSLGASLARGHNVEITSIPSIFEAVSSVRKYIIYILFNHVKGKLNNTTQLNSPVVGEAGLGFVF